MDGEQRAADALSELVVRTFQLNGQFLAAAEIMARPVGLTAAWWQVLGAVRYEPHPVSGIAKEMGLARQSVQRIADLLVDKGLARYQPNPAHRRAKLLELTDEGTVVMNRLRKIQPEWANRISATFDGKELEGVVAVLARLVEVMADDLSELSQPE